MKNILIAQYWEIPLAHEIRKGILQFMEHRTDVEINCCNQTVFLDHALEWEYDGVIAPLSVKDQKMAKINPDATAVSIHYPTPDCPFPVVDVNPEQTAELAAGFLTQRNYAHFATFVQRGRKHGEICANHFVDQINRRQPDSARLFESDGLTLPTEAFAEWLKNTPKPAAIFCTNDDLAKKVCLEVKKQGSLIPDEIGVLSCGNNELVNTMGGLSVSSIRMPYEKIGFEAARLLMNQFDKNTNESGTTLLAPIEVVERLSTATSFHDDRSLNKARAYIREHAASDISVNDVAEHAGISLRILQKRFKEKLGHSPAQAIQHARIEIAKTLLSTTHLPMDEIAVRSGFPSANYMGKVFRTRIGQSPRAYRKQFASSSTTSE